MTRPGNTKPRRSGRLSRCTKDLVKQQRMLKVKSEWAWRRCFPSVAQQETASVSVFHKVMERWNLWKYSKATNHCGFTCSDFMYNIYFLLIFLWGKSYDDSHLFSSSSKELQTNSREGFWLRWVEDKRGKKVNRILLIPLILIHSII